MVDFSDIQDVAKVSKEVTHNFNSITPIRHKARHTNHSISAYLASSKKSSSEGAGFCLLEVRSPGLELHPKPKTLNPNPPNPEP